MQILAGQGFPDELPANYCFSNVQLSWQRSTETRLAGILLLPAYLIIYVKSYIQNRFAIRIVCCRTEFIMSRNIT